MSDCSQVRDSSRERLLKDSAYPFCQGEPGSMNAVSIPERRHQSRIACAVNSVPLSILVLAGQRPVSTITDSNTATVERSSRAGSERLAGELVDHVEGPHLTAIGGDVVLEVEGPHLTGPGGLEPVATLGTDPALSSHSAAGA